MKIIKNEKAENGKVELQLFFDNVEFDAAVEVVYRKNLNKYNVNGFRRGHVPRRVIEKMYGTGIFYEEALDMLLDKNFKIAIDELGYVPFTRPDVAIDKIENGEATVNCSFFVAPEFELVGYKGMEIVKPDTTVTNSEIEDKITNERTDAAREIAITDRPAQLNDIANINFEGFVDGVAFEGGKGEDYNLTLGSGQFIPGFEEQIVGKNTGDEFDVTVTFPTEYGAAELAGKEAVFKCKLNSIAFSEIPELTDDFVKEISTFDTVAEYTESVKAKLIEEHEHEAEHAIEDAVNDKLIAICNVEIPATTVDEEVENQINNLNYRLSANGLTLEKYLEMTQMTLDDLKKEFRPRAENQVKLRLVIEKIVKAEGLVATEEELEAKYAEISTHYNIAVETVKERISVAEISEEILNDKAYKLVKDTVVLIDKPADTADGE